MKTRGAYCGQVNLLVSAMDTKNFYWPKTTWYYSFFKKLFSNRANVGRLTLKPTFGEDCTQ